MGNCPAEKFEFEEFKDSSFCEIRQCKPGYEAVGHKNLRLRCDGDMLITSGKAFKCRKITTNDSVTAGKTTAITITTTATTPTTTTTSKPISTSSINNRSPPTTAFRSSPRTGSANEFTIPPDGDSNPDSSENTELPFVDSGAALMLGTTITMIVTIITYMI